MSCLGLALRNLSGTRQRTLAQVALVALLLCGLDLFAGWQGELLREAEQEAVYGERLGHLAVLPQDEPAFTEREAQRLRNIAERTSGVILVAPGQGGMAFYLANPRDWKALAAALDASFKGAGLKARLHRGIELSRNYQTARAAHRGALSSVTGAVLAAVMVLVFSTATLNRVERRREFALLRALGMHGRGVAAQLAAEAFLVTFSAVVLSLVAGTLLCWLGKAVPGWGLTVEPDPRRHAAALALVFVAVAVAVLVPALKALRDDVAEGLAGAER